MRSSRRCLSTTAAVAEALLGAWSDEAVDRRAVDCARIVGGVRELRDVFAVHEALAAPRGAEQLGGVGGRARARGRARALGARAFVLTFARPPRRYKLGWKNHALLAPLPAMYSPVFRGGFRPSGATVSLARHKLFCAEAEYGFKLARALEPGEAAFSEADVWAAVGSIELCVELCGTRLAEPDAADAAEMAPALLADAMCNALVVRGPTVYSEAADEGAARGFAPAALATTRVRLLVDGAEISAGDGTENPLDSPLASLTFLVNDLVHRRRLPLEAGALVIAGHTCQVAFAGRPAPSSARALAQARVARPTSRLEAEFAGLGVVGVELVDSTGS